MALAEEAYTPEAAHHDKPAAYVKRWNFQQRLQHMLVVLSVATLMLTGFPIKYSDSAWAQFVFRITGGFDNTFYIHIAAAVVMLGTAIYHVIYLLFAWRRYGLSLDMLPRWKDFVDSFHHGLFLLGIRKERPQFGRYSYLEKFEYFAIVFGTFVMGLSGLALLFPGISLQYLPRIVLHILRLAHSNEAFVSLLALVFGHFFFVHLNPLIFPSNTTWFNGRMRLDAWIEEHPLEYQKLKEQNRLGEVIVYTEGEARAPWANSKLLVFSVMAFYLLVMITLLGVFVPLLLQ